MQLAVSSTPFIVYLMPFMGLPAVFIALFVRSIIIMRSSRKD
jgi:hypothetical protein